jgi:hypothetical protein
MRELMMIENHIFFLMKEKKISFEREAREREKEREKK